MRHLSQLSLATATTLLTALNACTPAGKTPAVPGTTNPPGIAAATKAPVVGYDAASAKAFGNLGEYLGQLNRAVINLENKRPPLMPLKTGVFATKQAASADPADETNPPLDVSGDDDFLNGGLQGSGNEAVEKETTAADGSISGTIDENGDGTVDETFTETKPVETAKSDGGKTVAMTYAFDRKGDKDVFEVKEDVDASGKVTGGEMDWTDDTMGKQHVTFKGDEITFEPVPGMVFSLKASGLDAKGHTRMTGNIVFDERFATSQQQPGQGKPLAMATQALGTWYYFPSGSAQKVGWGTDGYGWIAAGTWCIDNEVGEDRFGIDAKGGFERIGWEFRRFWCQIKNNDKSWANDWRKARESRLEFRKLAADPALVLKVTATSGNGTLTGSNLIITMPNGAEMRATLPASGEATMQGVVK